MDVLSALRSAAAHKSIFSHLEPTIACVLIVLCHWCAPSVVGCSRPPHQLPGRLCFFNSSALCPHSFRCSLSCRCEVLPVSGLVCTAQLLQSCRGNSSTALPLVGSRPSIQLLSAAIADCSLGSSCRYASAAKPSSPSALLA
jgi:hypothetical protein